MKKIIILVLVFISLYIFNANALSNEHILLLDDVNTLNFKERTGNLNYQSIKKICSYDFCDYMRSDSINISLELFTNNYLKTIKSDDVINTVKVKGIKITKIILNN